MKPTAKNDRAVERNENGVKRVKRDRFGREKVERKAFLPRSRRAFDVEELDVEIRRRDVGESSPRLARKREIIRDRRVKRDAAKLDSRR